MEKTKKSQPIDASGAEDPDGAMAALLSVMERLRDPVRGCPWDLQQDLRSLIKHTLEEAYEVADAIEREDMPSLKDELGDLLFQIVFYAQITREKKLFDFWQVVTALTNKMIARHPHVFGNLSIADADALTRHWEKDKADKRDAVTLAAGRVPSALDGVTLALPALQRALKLQQRAARVGFDWQDPCDILHKLDEEVDEVKDAISSRGATTEIAGEIGDLLFVAVNLARRFGIDPEGALRGTNEKFERRFRFIERRLNEIQQKPESSSLETMERLWQEAKEEEPKTAL